MRCLLIISFGGLIGCTDFPDVGGQITQSNAAAPYPVLQPLEPLLAKIDALDTTNAITAASVVNMNNRIVSLQARAASLRGPVVEPAVRARMRRGVAVPAAIR